MDKFYPNQHLKLFGLDNIIEDITMIYRVRQKTQSNQLSNQIVLQSCFGVLVSGPAGTGKTTLAKIVAQKLQVKLEIIDCLEIDSKSQNKSKDLFIEILEHKKECIILLENVDVLTNNLNRSQLNSQKTISDRFFNYNLNFVLKYLDLMSQEKHLFVIGTSTNSELIDTSLIRPHRLAIEFSINLPNKSTRKSIATSLIDDICHSLSKNEFDDLIDTISSNTSGFTGSDLINLIGHALVALNKDQIRNNNTNNSHHNPPILQSKYIFESLKVIKPTIMRSFLIKVPKISFKDIGGYHHVKQQIIEAIKWPQIFSSKLQSLGIETPRGIILYGPPGCCKTMLAKAIANETSVNFIAADASQLIDKYVGESEKAIKRIFMKAQTAAPCIIFFDEFDSIASKRTSSGEKSGHHDSLIGTLLTEIDGIQPLNDVVIIAATNRIDKIDKALLRPGRFDRKILVDLPNHDDRCEIIEILCKKFKLDVSSSKDINPDCFKGLSGAEIVNCFKEAGLKSFAEDFDAKHIKSQYLIEYVQKMTLS